MNDDNKAKLQSKLVDLVNYVDDLKDKKKEFNASIGEQIKEAEKKMKYIGRAIGQDDQTLLQEAFGPEELDYLLNDRLFSRGDDE